MTTNGVGLDRLAEPLAAAGLDRVNVSLDTIDPTSSPASRAVTASHDVEAGLKAAAAAGLAPVKVNAVAMRGVNDALRGGPAAVVPRPRLRAALHRADAARRPARLGRHDAWCPPPRCATRLEERFPLTELPAEDRGSAPAERFLVDGGPATVGIIASVSAPFCQACDRVRLTADGQVRNCLFSRTETDLRGPLRDGRPTPSWPRCCRARCGARPRATASASRASSSPTGPCPPSAADHPPGRPPAGSARRAADPSRLGGYRVGAAPSREEAPHREELAQAGAVLLAGQPHLAALRGVQLRVVPQVRPGGGLAAALGAADAAPAISGSIWRGVRRRWA